MFFASVRSKVAGRQVKVFPNCNPWAQAVWAALKSASLKGATVSS